MPRLRQRGRQQFGRLDIVVNNAGIRECETAEEASATSWNEIINVILMSYAFCAKAAVPLMRRGNGAAVVNVASVRSVVAGGGNLLYDTTKGAIAGLRAGWPPTMRPMSPALRCSGTAV